MNLYYEDVPATDNEAPQLPPLLRSEAMEAGTDVLAKAISRAGWRGRGWSAIHRLPMCWIWP